MTARCPHGFRWFKVCYECDEEHRMKLGHALAPTLMGAARQCFPFHTEPGPFGSTPLNRHTFEVVLFFECLHRELEQ